MIALKFKDFKKMNIEVEDTFLRSVAALCCLPKASYKVLREFSCQSPWIDLQFLPEIPTISSGFEPEIQRVTLKMLKITRGTTTILDILIELM